MNIINNVNNENRINRLNNVLRNIHANSKFKIALFWICGIESNLKENFNEDLKVIQKVDTSIEQDPFWSNICDLNAVIALSLNAFVIAFYNKYDQIGMEK